MFTHSADISLQNACISFLEKIDCISISASELANVLSDFGLSAIDVYEAENKLKSRQHLQYENIKALLGLYLEEFINIFHLSVHKKSIYASMPMPLPAIIAMQLACHDKATIKTPELFIFFVLRGIFGWQGQIIKNNALSTLPCCGLHKLRLEMLVSKRMPIPDVLWNWNVLCDSGSISSSLAKEVLPKIINSPINKPTAKSWSEQYITQLLSNINMSIGYISSLLSVDHIDAVRKESGRAWMSVRIAVEGINRLAYITGGELLSGNSLALVQSIYLLACSDWAKVVKILNNLLKELKATQQYALHAGAATSPCLFCYYLPFTLPDIAADFATKGIRLIGSAAFLSYNHKFNFTDDIARDIATAWCGTLIAHAWCEQADLIANALQLPNCIGYLTGMFSTDKWLGKYQQNIADYLAKQHSRKTFFHNMDFWSPPSFSKDFTIPASMQKKLNVPLGT